MLINKLTLLQYKNHKSISLNFHSSMNCFVGNNGVGKTNLLDAIYYSCIGKSYFSSTDLAVINQESDFFRIEAQFNLKDEITIVFGKQQRKTIQKNKSTYERLSDHLGYAPVVCVSPNDNQIILGGSDLRRRTMNATISQYEQDYAKHLMAYNKLLAQRNETLKSNTASSALLDVYDSQMAQLGQLIYKYRTAYVHQLETDFFAYYQKLSGGKEQARCSYQSQLQHKPMIELLKECRQKDIILKRSTVGIHKDDLYFELDEQSLKKIGSQGQQKTFLFALKLAEYEMLSRNSNKNPLLLLDDVFEKLDDNRIRELFKIIPIDSQTFITDTNEQRIQEVFAQIGLEFATFNLSKTLKPNIA